MTVDELRTVALPAEEGYRRFPDPYRQMSASLEEAEWLRTLIAAIRPAHVLELGTGLGATATFIADALPAGGILVTVEPLDEIRAQAEMLLSGLPVTVLPADPNNPYWPDLVYIDSGYAYRVGDIERWLTNGYQGLVVVHDADRGYPQFALGVGVTVPTANGMWIGRAR